MTALPPDLAPPPAAASADLPDPASASGRHPPVDPASLSGRHAPATAGGRDWQSHLVELLAKLEHHRLLLVGARFGPDGDYALDQFEAALQLTEDVSKKATFADAQAAAQMDAMARAGAAFAGVNDARKPGGRSLFKSVLSAFAAEDGAPSPAVAVAADLTLDALHAYFALFTAHYPSSLAARGWVDAASAFLTDFKQTVRELADG